MSINLSSADTTVIDQLELRRSKQLEFLQIVLRAIGKRNSNPDIIYPLFLQNLDLLDLNIIEVLKDWANTEFSNVDHNQEKSGSTITEKLRVWLNSKLLNSILLKKKLIAVDILNLGNLIQEFKLGDQSINIEISIECYTTVLRIFTINEDLTNLVSAKNNLANAYRYRIRGDREENLERSINGFQSALQACDQVKFQAYYNRTNFSAQRAVIKNNLGNAYCDRIRGDREENLERSINEYQSVLQVYGKILSSVQWAAIRHNLANALSESRRGDREKNLEMSIDGYKYALQIYKQTDFPTQWATIQHNLANAYKQRIKGDRKENLKHSIKYYLSAMEVFTPESFPCEWVKIQMSLARFSIEKLQNYQVATEHLQFAYEHLLENNNNTGLLSQIMFELARCFHQTSCLEQAKIYFKDSIRLCQRLEQPTQVAAATSALGNLELQMGLIDDARLHLQTALEFYQAADNLERVESIQELQQYLPVTSGASE
jgi:Soluble NSF attachment protein, SNAP/Tetratricopeptide repeat